jgi:hypothetical protein
MHSLSEWGQICDQNQKTRKFKEHFQNAVQEANLHVTLPVKIQQACKIVSERETVKKIWPLLPLI